MRRKPKATPRTGVHVSAPTPRLYREFLRLVSATACAERAPTVESFTVLNEAKWAQCLSACETSEDAPERTCSECGLVDRFGTHSAECPSNSAEELL